MAQAGSDTCADETRGDTSSDVYHSHRPDGNQGIQL